MALHCSAWYALFWAGSNGEALKPRVVAQLTVDTFSATCFALLVSLEEIRSKGQCTEGWRLQSFPI